MKDILIKNIKIILEDKQIDNGMIEINEGKFSYVGEEKSEISDEEYKRIINGKGKIASPGLVNAHTHTPMVLLRNYSNDTSLYKWLFDNIIPAENKLSGDDIYWGAKLAAVEMIQSGTTAFMDMYIHINKLVEAFYETGLKACISKDVIKSNLRQDSTTIDKEGFNNFYKQWNGKGNRINVNMEIHSVYLYDEQSLRKTAEFAKELNVGIHIHILENLEEKKRSIEMYNMNSLKAAKEFGILDVPVTAAHCVHVDKEDIQIIKNKNISVVHNPSSNLKLGSGIAKIPEMLDQGINVALGTDGAASNNNLNMIEEMHIASLIHKGVNFNPEIMKAKEIMKIGTINGAKAIGFENTGIIKEGMDADLILIDTNKPHIQPVRNYDEAIVYSAQGSDVDTVIVNGEILMENREVKTIDVERAMYEVNEIALKI